jgi:hypothetical protein
MRVSSASLGAVATYGLVSDQSPSAFLESESGRFSEKAIILLRLRRRPGPYRPWCRSRLWTDQ